VNQTLLESVYNQIKSAVSATTEHVYFLFLPSEELLQEDLTITYELNNTDNEDTFDSKEALKYYSLRIKMNAPTVRSFSNSSVFIKGNIYVLNQINSDVKQIRLVTEEVFYDSELKVFTEYLQFELQVT
jgi:hypothetical protein